MPAQKTQAIVIRTFPLGEFHKIITFYTPDFGKVKAIAYGVKSAKSRLGGSLELLNHGTLLFNHREHRELQSITDFSLINGFDAIRTDFTRITYGCYFAELVDVMASVRVSQILRFSIYCKAPTNFWRRQPMCRCSHERLNSNSWTAQATARNFLDAPIAAHYLLESCWQLASATAESSVKTASIATLPRCHYCPAVANC